jgi:hypothetical protein
MITWISAIHKLGEEQATVYSPGMNSFDKE